MKRVHQLFTATILLLAVVMLPLQVHARTYGIDRVPGFVENRGQITDQHLQPRTDIQFVFRANESLDLYIGNAAKHYQFIREEQQLNNDPLSQRKYQTYRMDVELVGADKNAELIADDVQPYYERHYTGRCAKDGITAHAYQKVTYRNVYPNIDWVLRTEGKALKHEFVVHKGGKISDIKLRYSGATSIKVDANGNLCATTPYGDIKEDAPVTYATGGSVVASRYVLEGNVLRYAVAEHAGEVTIDPTVNWATYYGTSSVYHEILGGMSLDNTEHVYLCGQTGGTTGIATSGAFQTTLNGLNDGFLAKFDSAGVLEWATYFGGNSRDVVNDVAADRFGNVYIAGQTESTSGLATAGSHQAVFGGSLYDAFLARFDNTGARIWATYYGGTAEDYGEAITVDLAGNVYVAGYTMSYSGIGTPGTHQPSPSGASDIFLAKFNNMGMRQWGSYLGGTFTEKGHDVVTDAAGNIYVGGETQSTGLGTAGVHLPEYGSAVTKGLLSKFNPEGGRIWTTYFGGTGQDGIAALTVDSAANVYIAGGCNSTSGIATTGAHQATFGGGTSILPDAFLAKLDSTGHVRWGTYYGGADREDAQALAVDSANNIYMSGYTKSSEHMATPWGLKPYAAGNEDVYLVKFDSSGLRL